MEYIIGVTLALAVASFATLLGLDRERSFYATVTIVVASYYALFAVMGGVTGALIVELFIIAGFVVLAAMGFRFSPWLFVIALAGHGLLDAVHGHVITNPGVPDWWPMFCMSYDLTAAAYLAWRLVVGTRAPNLQTSASPPA